MSNSKYNFWTWLIAIVLAVYLFWQWQHGHGVGGCCSDESSAPKQAEAVAVAPVVTAPPFQFRATGDGFDSSGDSSVVSWLAQHSDLVAWLKKCGVDCQVSGGAQAVVLAGSVENEQIKVRMGEQAQAFFGSGVVVDNQLQIKAAEQPIALVPPPAAKLYFETAKTELPLDAEQMLKPIVDWMKSNMNAKVVLSGFHDSTGNKASNEQLAKNRAKAVREALKSAGVDESRIVMRKPEVVDGGGDLAEARRVEASIE